MRSIFFFFFYFTLSEVHSAVINTDQIQIPGHEGECYDKSGKIFYQKGDLMKNEEGECVQLKCLGFLENIGKLRIETLTCPTVEAGLGCSIIQDLSLPYPKCCPQVVSVPSPHVKSCKPQKQEQK